jgi:murein L,D-transpeptidase YcbB/YkuD
MAAIAADAAPFEAPGSTDRQVAAALAAAGRGRPRDAARAEVALSLALGAYGGGVQAQAGSAQLAFLDPDFPASATAQDVLERAAHAPSLAGYLRGMGEINPVYHALRNGLATYRKEWSRLPQARLPAGPALQPGDRGERVGLLRLRLGLPTGDAFDPSLAQAVRRFQAGHGLAASGVADAATLTALNAGAAHYERLILANLQRARALPPPPGRRFILVNPAAAQLWLYEDGRATDSMRVVVGTRREQTPMMAGLIRYVVFNPYWEVPVDLVRDSIAPKVLKAGPGYFKSRRLQALSDWSDEAVELDPQQIDWRAVAAGRLELHVRQAPGGDNMMGAVKVMLPNELGIYLHDTPNKGAFRASARLLSAGCVRLERAHDLVAWLLGGRPGDTASFSIDQRIDLDTPAPVYIAYLTAAPDQDGRVTFYPDVYGRDPPLLAALGEGQRPGAIGA